MKSTSTVSRASFSLLAAFPRQPHPCTSFAWSVLSSFGTMRIHYALTSFMGHCSGVIRYFIFTFVPLAVWFVTFKWCNDDELECMTAFCQPFPPPDPDLFHNEALRLSVTIMGGRDIFEKMKSFWQHNRTNKLLVSHEYGFPTSTWLLHLFLKASYHFSFHVTF